MNSNFLGKGWSFPFELDADGQFKMADSQDSIRESIWTILSTSPGERVMRPDFGAGIDNFVFQLNDAALAGHVADAIREALAVWEPRIDVLDVNAFPDKSRANLLLVDIQYQVRTTNSRFNLVYPFYLE
jgi:phage baseplate assembly protein W